MVWCKTCFEFRLFYAKAVLKFTKLNTAAQQREAVVQGRSLLPYRLRYIVCFFSVTSIMSIYCCAIF
ncbi:MAG: hypothetical protein LBK06_05740 [Planctomycetaceae bacterium]|nr:hypothetical protein [Planctomycetaceae bacterium]